MIVTLPFVNRVVGTASGFRDVALNFIEDEEAFTLPTTTPTLFPVATQPSSQDRLQAFSSKNVTRWRDGSHWTVAGDLRFRNGDIWSSIPLNQAFIHPGTRQAFPKGTDVRNVADNMREQTVRDIQEAINRNIVVMDGVIWSRCPEPCYRLVVDGERQHLYANFHSGKAEKGFHGQIFRLDEEATFRSTILDYTDRGWFLRSGDGVLWSIPDMEITIPEAITLDAGGETILDMARHLRPRLRDAMPSMSHAELEAACDLLDVVDQHHNFAGLPDEAILTGLLDGVRRLFRYGKTAETPFSSPVLWSIDALHLATETWESREIGSIIPPSRAAMHR